MSGIVNSHRIRSIWAPPSEPPRLLRPPGMPFPTSMPSLTRCWRNSRPWRRTARSRPASGPKPPLAGAALRKATMAIWCLCFCGMQWRRSDSSATSRSARCTAVCPLDPARSWRRLLDRLRRAWRLACGDAAEPSAVVIDSRSCRSAPSCFERGIDGGKKIRGVKIQLAVDKHGIPLAIDVSPANPHDTKGIVPVLRELAGQGFRGSALGDLGYRGKRLAKVGQALGITVKAIARGHDGKFLPAGICWVVERSFAWLAATGG